MKRYKVNRGRNVNARASKNGIKWEYKGRTDNPQESIEEFEQHIELYREWHNSGYSTCMGLRITDTETGRVIYEKTI